MAVVGMLYVGRLERPSATWSAQPCCSSANGTGQPLPRLAVSVVIAGRLSLLSVRFSRPATDAAGLAHVQFVFTVPGMKSIPLYNPSRDGRNDRGTEARLNTANIVSPQATISLRSTGATWTLSFVSHELKSPVASTQNFTYLSKNGNARAAQ